MLQVDVDKMKCNVDSIISYIEDRMQKDGLFEICEHNILQIVQHSNLWRSSELKKIIRYTSFYKPDHDSVYILYKSLHKAQMGFIEIFNFKMFKNFNRKLKTVSCTFI